MDFQLILARISALIRKAEQVRTDCENQSAHELLPHSQELKRAWHEAEEVLPE